MRVLIVGAGAIGGYFGGRMLQAGRDITFLVRPRRALELAAAGLVIKSPNGDVTLKDPPVVQADTIKDKFDVVLLSCKAYDLDDAIKSFAPAVGERTAIIPLLNGMRHLDVLDKKIGASHVLGGLCLTAVTLNEKREVVQLGPVQSLGFGERDGKMSDRVRAIADVVRGCNFDGAASETILQDMWEKWVFLASNAASTSLRPDRHDPGGARRQGLPAWHSRRMHGGRDRGGLSAPRACAGTRHRDVDYGRLAAHRIDVPRHQGGPTGRS
jgi:2-dehydropantoate 2-reductase